MIKKKGEKFFGKKKGHDISVNSRTDKKGYHYIK